MVCPRFLSRIESGYPSQLHPLVQIWPLLAPKKQDNDNCDTTLIQNSSHKLTGDVTLGSHLVNLYIFLFFFSEPKWPCWWCLSRSWSSRKWQKDGLCLPVSSLHSRHNCSLSLLVKSSKRCIKNTHRCLGYCWSHCYDQHNYVCQTCRNQTAEMMSLKGRFVQWITFGSLM